jgi:hypothetical protein
MHEFKLCEEVHHTVPTTPAPVLLSATFPEIDQSLVMTDSVKIVLSGLMEAFPRLDEVAVDLLLSAWATEVFEIMTKAHKIKFLRDPAIHNAGHKVFSSRENLAKFFKVSHFYRL